MSERSLLVLGASRYQLEVITKAQQLGYRVVTTDNVPSNPGHTVADRSYVVDTTDLAKVLEIARAEDVIGVLAPCTDVAVPTAAHVASELGLCGIPLARARSLTSKLLFRELLAREGLPVPRFQALLPDATFDSLPELAAFPMIIKPEGSSGSKGIFIVRTPEEVLARLPETMSFSPFKRAILEQLIEGRQGTCEGIVLDGKIVFSLMTDRETAPPPFVATAGHFVPSTMGTVENERALAQIAAILALHEVKSSPFDCDFVIAKDGTPYLLELTPRLGGNSLTSLVRTATGIDLADVAVRLACRSPVTLARSPEVTPTAQLILGVPNAGRLSFDEAASSALRAEPWVRDLSFDYPSGHAVDAFVNGRNRVGEATLVAADRVTLDDHARELRRRLRLASV